MVEEEDDQPIVSLQKQNTAPPPLPITTSTPQRHQGKIQIHSPPDQQQCATTNTTITIASSAASEHNKAVPPPHHHHHLPDDQSHDRNHNHQKSNKHYETSDTQIILIAEKEKDNNVLGSSSCKREPAAKQLAVSNCNEGEGDGEECSASADDISGREKLKRHISNVAGQVWIPEIWGQEELLKDWADCTAFDSPFVTSDIMSARAALVEERRLEEERQIR